MCVYVCICVGKEEGGSAVHMKEKQIYATNERETD